MICVDKLLVLCQAPNPSPLSHQSLLSLSSWCILTLCIVFKYSDPILEAVLKCPWIVMFNIISGAEF